MRGKPLRDLLESADAGFASGEEDEAGIFQFRMHNVARDGGMTLAKMRRVPLTAHKHIERYTVRPRDVLFNATNSPELAGKSMIVDELPEPAVFSNHFLRLRSREATLDSRYLWRWLQWLHARGDFRGMSRQWVNQATVDRNRLLDLRVPLPPLDEQRRIAGILDQADEVRSARRRMIALAAQVPEALFAAMFAPVAATATVDEVSTKLRTGPFGSQLLTSEFVESGVAVLGLDNVVSNRFVRVSPRHITEEKYAQLTRYTVAPGDVLISIMGTTGRCVVVPEDIPPAINTKHICAVTPNRKYVLPEFLRAAFLWHPDSRAHLKRQTKGSIMAGLNMGIIRSIPVPVPPMRDQIEFVQRGGESERVLLTLLDAAKRDDALFASLQARAFSGKL